VKSGPTSVRRHDHKMAVVDIGTAVLRPTVLLRCTSNAAYNDELLPVPTTDADAGGSDSALSSGRLSGHRGAVGSRGKLMCWRVLFLVAAARGDSWLQRRDTQLVHDRNVLNENIHRPPAMPTASDAATFSAYISTEAIDESSSHACRYKQIHVFVHTTRYSITITSSMSSNWARRCDLHQISQRNTSLSR